MAESASRICSGVFARLQGASCFEIRAYTEKQRSVSGSERERRKWNERWIYALRNALSWRTLIFQNAKHRVMNWMWLLSYLSRGAFACKLFTREYNMNDADAFYFPLWTATIRFPIFHLSNEFHIANGNLQLNGAHNINIKKWWLTSPGRVRAALVWGERQVLREFCQNKENFRSTHKLCKAHNLIWRLWWWRRLTIKINETDIDIYVDGLDYILQ